MLRSFSVSLRPSLLLSVRLMSSPSSSSSSGGLRSKPLLGKVAIVTASTDGIGYAIAQRLAQDGASVMISSRKEDNVLRAVKEMKEAEKVEVEGMVCHVGKEEHRKRLIEETVAKFGGLDILVSNAAVNPSFGPTTTVEQSSWDKILEINIKCAARLVTEALPHLQKNGNGSVVFVSSIGGYQPFSALGPYSVSKTALFGLTKALAYELAPAIRVNCIAPGIIKTKFSSAIWQNDFIATQSLKNIPMGRFGRPDECAGIVSFLCSQDASYITGETVVVAGGMPSRL